MSNEKLVMNKYCKKCQKETIHRKLKKMSFFTQTFIALRTGFGVSLRENDLECNSCGLGE